MMCLNFLKDHHIRFDVFYWTSFCASYIDVAVSNSYA